MAKTKKMDRLIVMDDVPGVADISRKFETFLTVSRKFGYHCIYVYGEERDMQTLISTFSGELESQQDLNFFQDDNNAPK